MSERIWTAVALAAAIILSVWLWNRPAHPAQAEWYVVVWLDKGPRAIPQKTHEACKADAAERARKVSAACLSRAEVEALGLRTERVSK